jgi:hypothetical protein
MGIRDLPLQIADRFLDTLKNSGQRLGGGLGPDKGRDLSTVERTEFRQFGDQGLGDCLSDAGHGSEEILFLDPDGRSAYLIVDQESSSESSFSSALRSLATLLVRRLSLMRRVR